MDIHRAVTDGNMRSVKIILQEARNTINKRNHLGLTPLHLAVEMGFLDIAKYLLSKGANVRECTMQGETPFHMAAHIRNHIKRKNFMSLLLNNGSHIQERDKNGETVLHKVIKDGHDCKDTIEFLMKKGIDVSIRDKRGRTPSELQRIMRKRRPSY